MNYIIYKHTFPNGKIYIGLTNQEPEKRWRNGHGYMTQPIVLDAIIKYGWINIKHEILCTNLNKNEAEEIEYTLINELQSYKHDIGYNVLKGKDIDNSNTKDYKEKQRESCKTKKSVKCVETNKIYTSLKQVQDEFKVSHRTLSLALGNKHKTVGGFHWELTA